MNLTAQTSASREVRIPCGDAWLYGDLTLPPQATGLVLFVHGSGGSRGRHSARNRRVAQVLQKAGIATLLFDVLTAQEALSDVHTSEQRADVSLLTQRLQEATRWALMQPALLHLPLGYFGAGGGSAAAIIAAARLPERIDAVVSCGGWPDLAGPVAVAAVSAPTLLIAGGADLAVAERNAETIGQLRCHKQLALIEGATHQFDERGALDQVAELAASWFATHLAQPGPTDSALGQAANGNDS